MAKSQRSNRRNALDKNKFISDQLDAFQSLIFTSGNILSDQVIRTFLDQLNITDGKIENSDSNINRISLIDRAFKLFTDTQGVKVLTAFADDIMDIIDLGKAYYVHTIGRQVDGEQIESIILKTMGMKKDGDSWTPKTGGFLDKLTTDPTLQTEVKRIVFKQITSEVGYQDLKNTLKDFIAGTNADPGAYYQHYERFAFDTYSQVDRMNSKLHADRLGLKYFFYNGGTVKDSREFCIKNHGKVFTTEQAEKWKEEVNKVEMRPGKRKPEIKVVVGPIVEKGMEDQYDPLTDMGGIKCRHSADFVSNEVGEAYLKRQQKKA